MYAVLLGILQGITEFLPVSSSGHLVLAQSLLPGFQEPAALFDAILHGGTLVAVLVYFRTDVTALLSCLRRGGDPGHRRLLLWLVAGTVPTGVVGVLFKGPLETLFEAPRFAAAMLLVTGALLWVSETLARPGDSLERLGFRRAFGIGLAQGLAIIPGISRSGTTIAAATLLGIRGEDAARFSFLLAIPAILGALVLQLPEMVVTGGTNWSLYVGGAAAACISGLWAIRFLMKVIRKGRLRWFAVYCWALGLAYLFLGPRP